MLPERYTLTGRGADDDDYTDIELRTPTEKITIAERVDDRFAPLFLAAPDLLAELESARKTIALAIDNMPYLFPPQGQRDRLSAEQLAWREKFEAATKSARAVIAKARGK